MNEEKTFKKAANINDMLNKSLKEFTDNYNIDDYQMHDEEILDLNETEFIGYLLSRLMY